MVNKYLLSPSSVPGTLPWELTLWLWGQTKLYLISIVLGESPGLAEGRREVVFKLSPKEVGEV